METATKAALGEGPVAKAFHSGELHTPTSGIGNPAFSASWATVVCTYRSLDPPLPLTSWMPIMRLADSADSCSERPKRPPRPRQSS